CRGAWASGEPLTLPASAFEHGLEAAPDHPLAIEGHVHVLHGRIVLPLVPGCIGARLVGPGDPGEHHLLALLQLDGALEVRGLAILDLRAPGLDLLGGAQALEERPRVAGRLDVALLVGGGNGGEKTDYVGHGAAPVVQECGDHAPRTASTNNGSRIRHRPVAPGMRTPASTMPVQARSA